MKRGPPARKLTIYTLLFLGPILNKFILSENKSEFPIITSHIQSNDCNATKMSLQTLGKRGKVLDVPNQELWPYLQFEGDVEQSMAIFQGLLSMKSRGQGWKSRRETCGTLLLNVQPKHHACKSQALLVNSSGLILKWSQWGGEEVVSQPSLKSKPSKTSSQVRIYEYSRFSLHDV